MGHPDAQVLVRDPLVLQVTLPRFLSLGDAIDVPVAVPIGRFARRRASNGSGN
ncbi:MAG TPA: hypothetical protein VKM72_16205 [Thermoanaerobaculia bacterium]|nr:hypothetical protein [Thermoanaerobaculia bacterium]